MISARLLATSHEVDFRPGPERLLRDLGRNERIIRESHRVISSAVQQGRGDYTPVFFSEMPALIASGRLKLDYALISVSPPDKYGFCSYGVTVDVVKAAAEHARVVIAEVNRQMPRTLGDSFIRLSQIDHVVESNVPTTKRTP